MNHLFKAIFVAILLLLFPSLIAAQRVVRIGIVLDGPSDRNSKMQREFQQQIVDFFSGQREVRFPSEKIIAGDWTVAGVKAAIDRLLADKEVDVVLALGAIGSYEIAMRQNLLKPAIAGLVFDAELQGLPQKDGASGVKNLNYLNASPSAKRSIKLFREIVPFKKLAILANAGFLEALPQLHERATKEVEALGVEVAFVPVTTSAAAALQALPADAEAVYITPLFQLSENEFRILIAELNQRRLPSFSFLGRVEVEQGILASYAPKDEVTRRARRVAINIQRLLNGEEAGNIPVDFSSEAQLTINMATARTLGFYPNRSTLTEAELINQEMETGRTLSLATAVREAVSVNLDLLVANKKVDSGRQEVNKARAPLLPQVNASALGTLVREETAEASFGRQAERQLDGALAFSQVIYSEPARANYSIQNHLQSARENDRNRVRLDVALQAAAAYLHVLRTKALDRIQRSNLKLTLSHLELARLREKVGAAGSAEVYRWESQLATSRKNVLDAEAQVKLAEIEMNRVLNRPLEEPFTTEETATDDTTLITSEKLLDSFDNPQTFALLRDFMVQEGLANLPELKQLAATIAAQQRAKTATERAFWIPNVALQAGVTNIFSQSGAGSEGLQFPPTIPVEFPQPQDFNWSIGLQLSIPLFTGFGRMASRQQANVELERLRLERQSVQLAISQRIRSSLHVAGASYTGIQQARDAAEAAHKNLELVADAYSRGAVSIITLIDAQNAALVADEAAANAAYNFLIDLMKVERSIGQFNFFRTAKERQAFFGRLEEFYRKAGVAPERR